jgi:hypothetical protein
MFISKIDPGVEIVTEAWNATPPEGMSLGLEERDFAAFPYGSIAPEFSFKLLSWPEIVERAEFNERNKCRTSDLLRAKGFLSSNQNGTNYCWNHGCVNAMMGTQIIMGMPKLNLSAASSAAPIKGYRNVGGWGGEALQGLAKDGVATVDFWPYNKISRSLYTPEMQENAKLHRVTDWEDMPGRDKQVLFSALVQNIMCPVAYNWWGHLVCAVDPLITGPSDGNVLILNSHGDADFKALTGSRSSHSDAQCVRNITPSYV